MDGDKLSGEGELILPGEIKVFKNKPIYKAGNGITIFEGENFDSQKLTVKFFPHSEMTMAKARSLKRNFHFNTVSIYDSGIYSTELGNNIFIAMELCPQETLYDYVNNLENFDDRLARWHSDQIINGLAHIHESGIAHKGLKPHNVLFNSRRIRRDLIKITPFAVNEYESGETFSALGYNAPEIIRHETLNDEKKCDVFSLGVLLVFILSNGKHPYGELPWQRDYNIASGVEPDLSIILLPNGKQRGDIIDLIRNMLQNNPESRPTAQDLSELWEEVTGDSGFAEFSSDEDLDSSNELEIQQTSPVQIGTKTDPAGVEPRDLEVGSKSEKTLSSHSSEDKHKSTSDAPVPHPFPLHLSKGKDESTSGLKRRRIKTDSELERYLSLEPGSSKGKVEPSYGDVGTTAAEVRLISKYQSSTAPLHAQLLQNINMGFSSPSVLVGGMQHYPTNVSSQIQKLGSSLSTQPALSLQSRALPTSFHYSGAALVQGPLPFRTQDRGSETKLASSSREGGEKLTSAATSEQKDQLQPWILPTLHSSVSKRRESVKERRRYANRSRFHDISSAIDHFSLSIGITVFKNKPIYKAGNGITIIEGLERFQERFGSRKIAAKFFPHSERTMTKARSLEFNSFSNTADVYKSGVYSTELGNSIFIAMELCSRETLYDYVNNLDMFNHTLALIHSRQIINGLGSMHHRGIAHRGLKPHNVLFESDTGHYKTKITPFAVNEYESGETFSAMGYNAPEVIRHETMKDEKKCDIFSLGVLLSFILSKGKHPYGELLWQRDYNIASGADPDLSIILLSHGKEREFIIDLIRKMLQHDPEARPTARDLCELWFRNVYGGAQSFRVAPSARISMGDSIRSNKAPGQLAPKKIYFEGSVGEIMLSQTVRKTSSEDSRSSVGYEAQQADSQRMGPETKDLGGSDDDKLIIKVGELSIDRTSEQTEMATSIYSTDIKERIKQKLLSPSAAVEDIGLEGGPMELFGCTLSLPPGAHQTRRPVQIAVRSSYTDAPEGYVVASPELNCNNFGVPFKGLATITLPLHVIPEDGQVQIISKQDGNSDWEILDVHPALVGRKVTFQVSHFSPFKAIFKYIPWFNTYLCHYVAFRPSTAEVRGVTCIDDERVKKTCIETLNEEKFELRSRIPDSIVLYRGEEVTYKYTCISPLGSQLKPDVEVITASDVSPILNSFILLPPPEPDINIVNIECSRTNSEKTTTSAFALEWRTPEIEGREQVLGAGGIVPVAGGQAVVNPVGMVEPIAGAHAVQVHQGQEGFRISTREFYELHCHALNVYHVDRNTTKGSVLILNNEFEGEELRRAGSEVDVQNLEELWNRMGFHVQKERNLSAVGMREACRDFAVNPRDASVLILIIMSHGGKENGEEFILAEDGVRVPSDELISPFTSTNSQHLRGIPKVFMFQACRGAQCDNIHQDANQEVQAIQARDPDRADMLIVYPSQSGAVSYRNPIHGSVLMNAIVNVFKRDAHDTHIIDLLTKVNSEVAPEGGRVRGVQASNLVSFLRKKLFLFPGWP